MKRAICPALTLALLLNFSLFSSAADSAKSLYNKGKIAEARQNYEQAYDFYKQAYDQKPQDLSYRAMSGCVFWPVLRMFIVGNC